jgi:hypothetical protein
VESWGVESVWVDLRRQHGEVGELAPGIKASLLENGAQCTALLIVSEQVCEHVERVDAHGAHRSAAAQRHQLGVASFGVPSIGECRRGGS